MPASKDKSAEAISGGMTVISAFAASHSILARPDRAESAPDDPDGVKL
jgi:hypothetical protein